MIDGIILGAITWASMCLTWSHLPEFIKRTTLRFPLLTDISASVFSFILLSGISHSIIAVVGSVVTGILINISIMIKCYIDK